MPRGLSVVRASLTFQLTPIHPQMYSDVLTCLTRDPLAGNVSPALIGTQGTIPLSIVSTIPDIMQHYKDCSASKLLGAFAHHERYR